MTPGWFIGLAAGVLVSVPCTVRAQAKKPATPADAKALTVELEQDGRPVAIKDHEAIVRRAPFALILTLRDAAGVFVSASFEPDLYETARSGRPFTRADFRGGLAGAEGKANESRDLFIRTPKDPLLHFWDCNANDTRFDQVTRSGAGCRGRRTVEKVLIGEEVPLGRLLRRPLQVVFLRGRVGDGGVEKEVGRDWLKLYLDTVPDSLKSDVSARLEVLFDQKKPAADRTGALQALAAMGADAIAAIDALAFEAAIKAREDAAVGDLRTVLSAEMAYASSNGGLYDGPPCLIEPGKCRPKYAGLAFLQLYVLETRNGYKKLFIPGPAASREEITKASASPSSLKDFLLVAWPETFGETGHRAFCADASGRICFVEGPSPPAKNGRCEAACTPLR